MSMEAWLHFAFNYNRSAEQCMCLSDCCTNLLRILEIMNMQYADHFPHATCLQQQEQCSRSGRGLQTAFLTPQLCPIGRLTLITQLMPAASAAQIPHCIRGSATITKVVHLHLNLDRKIPSVLALLLVCECRQQ